MITKTLSFTTFIICFPLTFLNTSNPQDPLLLFISGNTFTLLGRVFALSFLLFLCFKSRCRTLLFRNSVIAASVALTLFGLAGTIISPIEYSLFNYLKPLDYLLIAEAGVILGLFASEVKVVELVNKPATKSSLPIVRPRPRTAVA